MLKPITLTALLLTAPAWARAPQSLPPLTHLGVPAANLVTVDLIPNSDQ
jgi:hypothetical protein